MTQGNRVSPEECPRTAHEIAHSLSEGTGEGIHALYLI